jgi:hypothetical protein
VEINDRDPEQDGTYTVAKECPVKSNLCEWQPDMMEGVNCGFYNGFKKRCVYPRTCTHNTSSEHFLNLYDTFMGNISRYWNVKKGSKADDQIQEKCKELGISDEEGGGWVYAEFDDDGKTITLAELGTDAEISKLVEQQGKKRKERLATERKATETQLHSILEKYSGTQREDMEKAITLTKQLYGIRNDE